MKKFYVGVKGIVRDSTRGIILLHRDYASGNYWDIPGGRIDGNETFEQTLHRELNEELPGCKVLSLRELKGAFRLQKDIDEDISLVLLYFLVDATLPKKVLLSEEHKRYIFVEQTDDIPDGLNEEANRIIREILV